MRFTSLGTWLAGALLVAAVAPAAAQGCGPNRLKLTESVTLDVPPAEAWRRIGNFQDMSWALDTKSTTGTGGNVPDHAVRESVLKSGMVLKESLYKYDAAAMSYSYHIDKVDTAVLPIQNASVTLEVVPADDGRKSLVRWRAAFYRFLLPNEPAPDVADHNAAEAMRRFGQATLDGLKAKTEART